MSYILIVALAFGYLLGSIPFGLLFTRAAGLGDVRSIGSGNIGATNVLRTGNKKLAAVTLLFDILKGTAAVFIAGIYGPDAAMAAGAGAFLGHLFPVWLGFKGGKGVATYLGVLIGLAWQMALLFAAVWLAVAFLLRYSSAAALAAAVVVPVTLYFLGHDFLALLFALMSALLFVRHRTNISRLMAGTETRIGAKG
ncbi:MAG: glycerol-3-phosphate 1-O-acyltransferase PlsY [Alphaproteobacteria bacterium]|nr:glycerol-3-phosphate 1-O-acyltransferase PlsY [Alphaproteobacteria bacterium]MBU0802665.1 glycerol-3-phosphate 1-O-acyltransferase PlsY [Alphaproteobacteria bacterium]MBU0871462.1 glycerol-3-phosphate 1-O-acyltransferase PlsY [Alphaproteobacteria bacterium]MBU1400129.1 glycerol-3-phosphate 1-O-acyltransferase PlsY [Alphaproteobacteria bacterium]MBU1591249.1 glycerol-3-phosphate 1-O-acyltransferase PlsY [Alphaproteobacteria bacterium]